MEFSHVPVMVRDVICFLRPEPQGHYLDGTLGGGGHTEQILIASIPDGKVLGLDRDEEALGAARARLGRFAERLTLRQASFATAQKILAEVGWNSVNGVVLDLGVSSHQLGDQERGFSFGAGGRLDMRMDRRQSLDAHQIVNSYPVEELERILREYGEEPQARRIAQAIGSERKRKTLQTTDALAQLIAGVKGKGNRHHHPATQSFQAFRIAVNDELGQLALFLANGYELLKPQARMVVIAFHSLEDRLVKTAFRKWSLDCLCPPRTPKCQCGWNSKVKLLTKKPVVASASEIEANARSRSAKLRVVERI